MQSTGYGNATGMLSGAPDNSPRDRNESEMVIDRFDATLTQASDLANRLATFADRLLGARPETANIEGKGIGSSGFSHALNAKVDGLNRELDRAFEALQRMEKFL